MPKPTKSNSRYIAGIDGLRGLAVIAVIIYHLNSQWAPGGFLGVTIFFVLSGYLITDILIAEWDKHGKINMKDFWLRRARRLLPAFFVMLIFVVAWITLFDRSFLVNLRNNVFASLFYVSNWWFIFHEVSYFERFAPPSPLNHLWSLAVEEQFYIIFPLLLIVGLRFIHKRRTLAIITILIALLSAIAMAIFYQPGTDPSRVYYGTDTRAFSLLIGASLAMLFPSRKMIPNISKKIRRRINLIGTASFIVLICSIVQIDEFNGFIYRGGMALLSIVTACLIVGIVHPVSFIGKALSFRPLIWIGVRSYGMYLWQFPVIILSSPRIHTGEVNPTLLIFQIALIIVLSALSWYFVENPVRHGALKIRHLKDFWFGNKTLFQRWGLAFGILLLCVAGVGLFYPSSSSKTTNEIEYMITHTKEVKQKEYAQKQEKTKISKKFDKIIENDHVTKSKSQRDKTKDHSKPVTAIPSITAIGDSILVDVAPYIQEHFPHIVIDGKIGRQLYGSEDVIENLKAQGKLGEIVIVELGTNGAFSKKQMEAVLSSIGKNRKVFLINTRFPDPWEGNVNDLLRTTASNHSNVTLIDWYSESAGHNEYFYNDGTHPNPTGAKVYTSLIKRAILGVLM
ncbi:acyltransferase family protein [Heyndrickxia sp. NPDC080065]|uniref:acyltransferase family protein n=1 Tax=Heyndrickxia sp. NPDC080065 TaxID=3390568 RepID=UPI003CFDF715